MQIVKLNTLVVERLEAYYAGEARWNRIFLLVAVTVFSIGVGICFSTYAMIYGIGLSFVTLVGVVLALWVSVFNKGVLSVKRFYDKDGTTDRDRVMTARTAAQRKLKLLNGAMRFFAFLSVLTLLATVITGIASMYPGFALGMNAGLVFTSTLVLCWLLPARLSAALYRHELDKIIADF